MIEKDNFKNFIQEVIKNEFDPNLDSAVLDKHIRLLYGGSTSDLYEGLLAATYQTVSEVQDLIDMDQQHTLMAGEVKSIDSVWTKQLLSHGMDKQKAEQLVDKYSFDFIEIIQEDE